MHTHTITEAEAIKLIADQLTLIPLGEQRERAARSLIDELIGRRTLMNLGDHNDFNTLASPYYRITGFGGGTKETHRCIGRKYTSEALVTVYKHQGTDRIEVVIS